MPPSSLRQAPWPLHCSAARGDAALEAEVEVASMGSQVGVSGLAGAGSRRKPGVSTILPGLSRPSGSKARLTSRKASVRRGAEHALGEHAAHDAVAVLAAEAAAELEHEVGDLATRSPPSWPRPSSVLGLTMGRMCRQPTLAWP